MNFIISFIEQWLGALPKVVFAFLGALVCIMVVSLLWDRRMRLSSALIGIAAGLGLAFHSVVFRGLSALQPEQRLKMMGVAMGLTVIAMTVQAMRRVDLQRRYAVIWLGAGTGLLAASFHSGVLQVVGRVADTPAFSVLGGGSFFLLFLLTFHFSIAVTRLEQRYRALRERLLVLENSTGVAGNEAMPQEQQLPSFSIASLYSLFSAESVSRTIRGTRIGAPLAIAIATIAVLSVGLAAPQAMVGDEVTHYYMLVKQAQDLSQPNFYSEIPMASGGHETRRYPHSFGWHYLGALAYLVTGGSFAGVQLYQAFFLLQLLTVAYLLAKSRGGVESRSALLYVLSLASLPLCLIFSVAFYQDVPMTAQVLTAFYLLHLGRWLPASCFMALALAFKVTAVLFYPAFFFFLLFWEWQKGGLLQSAKALLCAALIVLGSTWLIGKAINIYAQAAFYPQEKLEILASVAKNRVAGLLMGGEGQTVAQIVEDKKQDSLQYTKDKGPETAPVIIANNPGDLRIKENYLVYGGLFLWLLLIAGGVGGLWGRKQKDAKGSDSAVWLYCVGGSFLLLTAYMTRTAPDARFFLPGLPFLLLPAAEKAVRLPKPKMIIILFASLALLQGSYVLSKAYRLRGISSGITAGIEYLKTHPPASGIVFMYPEGSYRLFPVRHEWYLGYRLRDFWRGDNDFRIQMLQEFGIGAVVVKKHLVAAVDEAITNLGVYPTGFVNDLLEDSRFTKVFDNEDLWIFQVPPPREK